MLTWRSLKVKEFILREHGSRCVNVRDSIVTSFSVMK